MKTNTIKSKWKQGISATVLILATTLYMPVAPFAAPLQGSGPGSKIGPTIDRNGNNLPNGGNGGLLWGNGGNGGNGREIPGQR